MSAHFPSPLLVKVVKIDFVSITLPSFPAPLPPYALLSANCGPYNWPFLLLRVPVRKKPRVFAFSVRAKALRLPKLLFLLWPRAG